MDGAANEDDGDDDLKLVRASAGLLADLEEHLPMLLWKPAQHRERHPRVHSRVKQRHLHHVVNLIEPFQAEPQLLDAKLKFILPPIVQAYLDFLLHQRHEHGDHVDLETAVCSLLYTLCKVRGYKIIVGFLNNEPRYLEPVLAALERTLLVEYEDGPPWQISYVLLLWLSHLLLTPFDLSSISADPGPAIPGTVVDDIPGNLPALIERVLRVGLAHISSPTKAQDAAAAMLVRLSVRPDVQRLRVADHLLKARLPLLHESAGQSGSIYKMLGALRLVAGAASSAELVHLMPSIYSACENLFKETDDSNLLSNAVAKKLVVKIVRNIAIISLHSMTTDGPMTDFVQSTDVLESVIDYLLRSLGDKDTPVRYAAAKAISVIIWELGSSMAQEIIQAILDSFKDDLPRFALTLDFTTVNALRWHGLTLALSHTLFKRSATPDQLNDIVDALISALQFQQRTATGSTLGTNVRDAANFGTWALARRYTTEELLSVSASSLSAGNRIKIGTSIIQVLAVQLILSACLDPAGNIRRGSSAALQELVGRHPDQISYGIALVQIVDYQAVSLRSRAMIDVANRAAGLSPLYWKAILEALLGWRGLGSADVASRESAATSIAQLSSSFHTAQSDMVLQNVVASLRSCPLSEVEDLHGHTLTAALLLENYIETITTFPDSIRTDVESLLDIFSSLQIGLREFSPRMLRSEFPAAFARLVTALCNILLSLFRDDPSTANHFESVDPIIFDEAIDRMLARREDWAILVIPDMVKALFKFKCARNAPLSCIGLPTLSRKVATDGSKSKLHGVGRAIALGSLAALYDPTGLSTDKAEESIAILSGLLNSMNVDWRVIGAKALLLVVEGASDAEVLDTSIVKLMCLAIHQGLNDYTIDERGDVGSLVRLQCIACVSKILSTEAFRKHGDYIHILEADIIRLSLEKLDRVRFQAAHCRKKYLGLETDVSDVARVSSTQYFEAALSHLTTPSPAWTQRAELEGCISCAGAGAEPLLQASRHVLASYLSALDSTPLEHVLRTYANIMQDTVAEAAHSQPALEVLAFLLDMQIPQRLSESSGFKWRNLLSSVQKSHHKSNDIPKILAAVHVYVGLAAVTCIRGEVLKKLLGMLKTNPYPRVRGAVAEALWAITREESLRDQDWTGAAAQNANVLGQLQRKYVIS